MNPGESKDRTREALNALLAAPAFQQLEHLLHGESAMDFFGVPNKESAHTEALRRMLTPHKIAPGALLLRSFITHITSLDPRTDALKVDDLDGLDLDRARVEKEYVILDGRRRLDLVVFDPKDHVLLILESKVDSSERDNQTTDYAAWARDKRVPLAAAGRSSAAPLLVLLGPAPLEAPERPFVHMTCEGYLTWLKGIMDQGIVDRMRPDDRRAVESVRDALRVREDVADAEVEGLVEALEQKFGTEILRLQREFRKHDIRRGHAPSIKAHKPTLRRLGIFNRGVPTFFRRRLLAGLVRRLTPGLWQPGRPTRTNDGPLLRLPLAPDLDRGHEVTLSVHAVRRPNEEVAVEVHVACRSFPGAACGWGHVIQTALADAVTLAQEAVLKKGQRVGRRGEPRKLLEIHLKRPSLAESGDAFVESEIAAAGDRLRALEDPLRAWSRETLPRLWKQHLPCPREPQQAMLFLDGVKHGERKKNRGR